MCSRRVKTLQEGRDDARKCWRCYLRAVASTYRAVFERDESGVWVARVLELDGCHTQGKTTLDEARERLREAMSLFAGVTGSEALDEDIRR